MKWLYVREIHVITRYYLDKLLSIHQNGSIQRNACVACEIKRATTKKVLLSNRQTRTDIHMPDKVIPMCCYALQATQRHD